MTEPAPSWKFYHPLTLWKVVLLYLAAAVVCIAPTLFLREGLGLPVPMWVASGLAGLLGTVATMALARRLARRSGSDASARSDRTP